MFCLDGGTYIQNHTCMCHIPKDRNSPPVDETGTIWTSAKRCRHYSCFTSLCKTHWYTLKQNKMVNIRVHTRKLHSSHDLRRVRATKQDKSRKIHRCIVHTTQQDKSHDTHIVHTTKQNKSRNIHKVHKKNRINHTIHIQPTEQNRINHTIYIPLNKT